jgi:hypothetical protein
MMRAVDVDADPDPTVAARGWAALIELFAQAIENEKTVPPLRRLGRGREGQEKGDAWQWTVSNLKF